MAQTPAGRGRPTKRTPDATARILKAIELGATYELAAAAGGITYDTLNEWRKTKPEFSDAINQAEGKAAQAWLTAIEKAAKAGQWQAAAWKLERRYPHMYGKTVQETKTEHSGKLQVEWINDWREPIPGGGDTQ